MKVKKKGLMQLPVKGYGVQTGIHPDISVHYSTLLEKPAICWGNVGLYPEKALFNKLKKEIKDLCGFGWGNNIESLYFYDGAHNFYRFGFHVQLFFKEQKIVPKVGNVPITKTLYKYELALYNPIDRTGILYLSGELDKWNSRFNPKHIERIGETMRKFIDTILNTSEMKSKLEEFKEKYK